MSIPFPNGHAPGPAPKPSDRHLDALVGRAGVAMFTNGSAVQIPGQPRQWSTESRLAWDGGSNQEMLDMLVEALAGLTLVVNRACDDLARHMRIDPEVARRRMDELYQRRVVQLMEAGVEVRKSVENTGGANG